MMERNWFLYIDFYSFELTKYIYSYFYNNVIIMCFDNTCITIRIYNILSPGKYYRRNNIINLNVHIQKKDSDK